MKLLDTLTLFGTVALAAPIGLLGIEELLVGGRPIVGGGFVFVAGALVAGGYFRPSLSSIVIGSVGDVVVGGGDRDAAADADGDADASTDTDGDADASTDTGRNRGGDGVGDEEVYKGRG
ncbi:hypothetical protein [Natronomonas sp. LN261]|jgi:hypothetical protein|uniref:DUF7533 family protein n=1 Tax=Natronomonas sp. LN261 TaxID=2750669 RepID=UPI0015EF1988|nr:hypothetical protein [Natronomonas sp. LN261]